MALCKGIGHWQRLLEMTRQSAYARLFGDQGFGDAIYQPVPADALNIGDVAYFTENTYHWRCNVFDISDEVFDLASKKSY